MGKDDNDETDFIIIVVLLSYLPFHDLFKCLSCTIYLCHDLYFFVTDFFQQCLSYCLKGTEFQLFLTELTDCSACMGIRVLNHIIYMYV